ncbi:MAG: hypothetical protein EBV30_10280, partial [Actinobacteria bacterium]|nr:hypothetical protein [Actinomycetota bacterium]
AGFEIYNGRSLIIEKGVPAGACVVCKESLHCTKLVNSWATVDPICDCGLALPIEVGSVDGGYMHVHEHRLPECKAYRERHPGYPRLDYVCQHCLFAKMQRIAPEIKCGRATCPNLKCSHHMGQQAHVRALTKNRTMMLTHREAQ